ncbi:hypothetical protein [uncultured Lactococcus sp.]|uniref:hypothetical protein n=1 Tax=uncultured Lactococcus sp. TaxID=167973 RepID=UPI0027DE49C1|nr:hypothetical protein [uncultured Lactococcus sp.]
MKFTKKQAIINGGIALLLVGGAVFGVLYNQHVQAEKDKQVQQEKKEALENAKRAEEELIKEAKEALLSAQKAPSKNNLEVAKKAISNLKDEQVVKELTKELEGIKTRVKLETAAKKAVSDYQKDAGNADKLKKAQTAVSKLTSSYSKALKAKLEKDIVTSKAQADKAKKAEETKKAETDKKAKAAQEQAQSIASAEEQAGEPQASASNDDAAYSAYTQGTPAPAQNNSGYVAPTSSGGNVQTPAQPNTGSTSQPSAGGNAGVNRPAGGTSNNNGGSPSTPTPAPTPAVTYTGWVRNKAGQLVWSQGGFSSLIEAARAAADWLNANATSGGWSSGAY